MKYEKTVQYTSTFKDALDVRKAVRLLLEQEDLIGLRTIKPSPSEPDYRIQAFFKYEDDTITDEMLPDNCRIVLLPDALKCELRTKRRKKV